MLRLAAPLQAWGDDSKFEIRRTLDIPTKSGVIGLLAAALGRRRDAPLSDLISLRMGVRVDQPGVIQKDFHMVHGENTAYVTTRYYLNDAIFVVGLETGGKAFLETLDAALRRPAYPLFLGRRSCPPTLPLVLGVREQGLEQALRDEVWQASSREKRLHGQTRLRLVLEGATTAGLGNHLRKDQPVSFNPEHRQYAYRVIVEKGRIDAQDITKEPETQHDAFGELR